MQAIAEAVNIAEPTVAAARGTIPGSTRLRLGYLDGLRGVAALYVVIFHVSQLCHGYATNDNGAGYHAVGDWVPGLSMAIQKFIRFSHFAAFGYGRFAVDVFIVLSGYCLMLPVARGGRDTVSGGFVHFMKRRAWRILPPYYAMIALTLLLGLIVPGMRMRDPSGSAYWDDCSQMFGVGPIVSHLLLIQSWTKWALRIDGPMWSVAVEWQIYLLFPLLMLPLRKRIGSIATAVVFFAGGQLGYWALRSYLLANQSSAYDQVTYISPWFAGQFAMGAMAASLAFGGRPTETTLYARLPWRLLTVFFALALGFFQLADRHAWKDISWIQPFREVNWGSGWVTDLVVSLFITCLIIVLTKQVMAVHQRGFVLKMLESRWAVILGEFSYSLYLVHFPVINAMDLLFRKHFGPATTCVLAYGVSLPLAVGLSYGFHVLFERPFMSALQSGKTPATDERVKVSLSPG